MIWIRSLQLRTVDEGAGLRGDQLHWIAKVCISTKAFVDPWSAKFPQSYWVYAMFARLAIPTQKYSFSWDCGASRMLLLSCAFWRCSCCVRVSTYALAFCGIYALTCDSLNNMLDCLKRCHVRVPGFLEFEHRCSKTVLKVPKQNTIFTICGRCIAMKGVLTSLNVVSSNIFRACCARIVWKYNPSYAKNIWSINVFVQGYVVICAQSTRKRSVSQMLYRFYCDVWQGMTKNKNNGWNTV